MPTSAAATATPIERWSLANAVTMICSAAGALWWHSPWPILVAGSSLLAGLVGVAWRGWTNTGRFGVANGTTALRVGLLGAFPSATAAGAGPPVALGVAFLLADGLDGWLARRRGLASEFGAFFDKEADALFLLVLCTLVVIEGRLPAWTLGAGLLRYGFVVLVFLLRPPEKTEERFPFARYAYGGMVTALLGAFLPYPTVYEPAVAVATGALLLSFARSTVQVIRRSQVSSA